MQPIQIFNRLLQPCGTCKAVAAGVLSIEQIEYDLSVICACFLVALHHGQLILVCQQCKVSTFHFKISFSVLQDVRFSYFFCFLHPVKIIFTKAEPCVVLITNYT